MDISEKLVGLRIELARLCDGFSQSELSKNVILSTRIKILYELKIHDRTPGELIAMLCVAKSNLANIVKSMIDDGVLTSYKSGTNLKNVNYAITNKGINELNAYLDRMSECFYNNFAGDAMLLADRLDDFLKILNTKSQGEKND